MRKTREILHLRLGEKLPLRTVAQSCNCSASRVHEVASRAVAAGLSWPLDLNDEELEGKLYGKPKIEQNARPEPDYQAMHLELGKRGVTLSLLWQEYRGGCPTGYGYSQYCSKYRTWRRTLDLSMRQTHAPGEKVFVDFAGHTAPVYDRLTGECTHVQIFVGAMGLSQYIYAEAVETQEIRNWVSCHSHMYEFFGGVPAVTVPDNLRSAVTKACAYDPELNRTYKDLSDHYDTLILPARVRKPKDKAKAENAVQQVERWVLAPLRNHKFFSLAELNAAISEQLKLLNGRPLTVVNRSRQELFDEYDKPALKVLPCATFRIPEWRINATVNIDYHVDFEGHYYSVPYGLARKKVDLRVTSRTVECLHQGRRVAMHARAFTRGQHSTIEEHRPRNHREYGAWPPERIRRWADSIGPQTSEVVEAILSRKRHPEQGYRAALGVIRLAKTYTPERLEKACERALAIRAPAYRTVHSILKTGFDQEPLPEPDLELPPIQHDNIRGSRYYSNEEFYVN